MPIEFWILCLLVVTFFGGWIAKVDYDRYKADCRRKDKARRRAEIEQDRILRWEECQKSAEGLWK